MTTPKRPIIDLPREDTSIESERRKQRLKELAGAVADVLEERAIARKASGTCEGSSCHFHPEDVKTLKEVIAHADNMKKLADPKVVEAICALADSWRTTQSVKTWANRLLWGAIIAAGGCIMMYITFRVLILGIVHWFKEGMPMS